MNTAEEHSTRVRRLTFILIAVEARARGTLNEERRTTLGERRGALLLELEHEARLTTVPATLRRAVVDVLDEHERLLGAHASDAASQQTAYASALSELVLAAARLEVPLA
jgi:hypothetical protein